MTASGLNSVCYSGKEKQRKGTLFKCLVWVAVKSKEYFSRRLGDYSFDPLQLYDSSLLVFT